MTKNFLAKNNLDYVIRSHEVKDKGYEVVSVAAPSVVVQLIFTMLVYQVHDGKLITVFSAPNYCDQIGNMGAFITFTDESLKPNFTSFKEVPHPNKKPMYYSGGLFNY